jgi:hypothetical protein
MIDSTVYFLSSSPMVADYVQRGLAVNASLRFTLINSFNELMTDYVNRPPKILILDYLLSGHRTDRQLMRLRGFPAYKEVPVILTFGPPFVQEAAAMAKVDKLIAATVPKPFTVNQLLQVILPLSLGLPSSSLHLSALQEAASAKPSVNPPGYDAINRLPGVRAQFQWSSQGEILAASNEDASRLSNSLARCLRSCYELGEECGLGDIIEIQLYGNENNGFLCSVQNPGEQEYQTIGILSSAMTQPDALRDQIHQILGV